MIREARQEDAEAIAEIYRYYIQNTVITFEEGDIDAIGIAARINKVQESGFSWLVAVEKEDVMGYAYASSWNDRTAYRHTAEITIYLSYTSQAKGWGTKLYEALLQSLRHQRIHSVIGSITLPNPASVAIHEKFGMVKVGHFKEVGYKFGKWLDVGYWQMQLSPEHSS